MAEVFLGALVNVLVDRLASGDLWNFARKERIDTQLTKWRSMLEQVQAVVADAEEKQITNRETSLWLSDLEDLSYDMDDVLDEFATEALQRKVMEEPQASTSKVRKFIPNCCTSFNPSTLVSDFRMRSEMNEITTRLQDLFNRRMVLGLKNIAAGGSGQASQRQPTSHLIIEPCFPDCGYGWGRQDLAQMVYNDEMVDEHFEMKAWVCVSEVFDIVGVTKAILEFVTKRAFEFKALAQVQDELKKALAGKKLLIVLDDVWNEDHSDWSSLKSPFNDGAIGSELSSSIGDLKHMRYLDLSCALILRLPESIGTLYNLQMLILRDCENLNKLPANTSDLISLRHLDITGANSSQELPPKIGKLTSLQTLSNFIVGNGNGSMITELSSLIHLKGTLSISGLENVKNAPDARRHLKDKQGLNVLLMKWSNVSDNARNESVESKVLDMLEPHKNLKELSIEAYGGLTFPTWIGHSLFSNMVYLKFKNCEKCTSLPPLGQLPSLAKPYIQGMKAIRNVGLEFYGLGRLNPFPALEILTFDDMPEWKEWTPFGVTEGAQAFAHLSELSIKRCPKLSHELPRNLPRLRNLYIEKCPVLVVAWMPSPTELNEVRNLLHFDSLVSLHVKDVSIAESLGSSEVGDQVVLKNSSHNLLSSLTSLKLENIRGHKCLPKGEKGDDLKSLQELSISQCPRLISFPVVPSTLKELRIDHCNGLVSLPELMLLNNLEKLNLSSCPSLTHLSSGSGLLSALRELTVGNCAELKSLIAKEGIKINCPSLECVEILEGFSISTCEKLKPLPNRAYKNLTSVEELELYGYPAGTGLLSHILDEGSSSYFTNLTSLCIENVDIGKLCGLHRLYSLRKLFYLQDCDGVSFPEDGTLSFPSSLVVLEMYRFPNLEKLSFKDFENLVSLDKLAILRCPELMSISELRLPPSLSDLWISDFPNLASFPEQGLPPTLSDLWISDCPKLASFPAQGLPPSLSVLTICDFPNLTSFPEQGLPPSLLSLFIKECPILKRRCEKRKGQYWRFIAHIPQVEIDNRFVFDPSS
ncbi:hypothetical protein RHGRI_000493 [Rhododendron griersonianum]|uniref:Disease resistance RPP13-like protein 1 n=1 Tax=Rhododendron griersonianum TaxID=479676 RepID=A0AAV6LGT3_9ERIC|nr:hypothetical protein RHGRI_000493 [Rhododendron griersonianum]